MNINTSVTSHSNNTTPSQDSGPQNSGTAASRDSSNAATTDSVTLSESARLLDSVTNIPATYPEPDDHRIAELKHEIIAGTYTMDSAHIAESLNQFNMNL